MTADPQAAPAGFLRLAGHPVRWRLLGELARSDLQVRELSALVGQRQSLTSYHLGQLRAGGLVTMRRSSADGRDTYCSLNMAMYRERLAETSAALHPGLRLVPAELTSPAPEPGRQPGRQPTPQRTQPSAQSPVRVLFLCTGNSARSQVAEAILNGLGGPSVEAVSAGSHPKALHADAIRVMRDRGIDISGARSKHLSEFVEQRFDYVISLCDRVREVCPDFPGPPAMVHWSIADPAAEAANADGEYTAFVRMADELSTRIQFLLYLIKDSQGARRGLRNG
jgi:protein-tyrosine-phosphatase/DNA-binding transcriptional ArsR family regulator